MVYIFYLFDVIIKLFSGQGIMFFNKMPPMIYIKKKIIILVLLLLSSCSFITSEQVQEKTNSEIVHIAENASYKLLPPAKLGDTATLNQMLKGKYTNRTFSLNVISDFNKEKMSLIGLSGFGTRIFTINYDGKNTLLESPKSFKLAEKIKPKYLLMDIQFVYFKIDDVKNNLIGDVSVKDTHLKRIFYYKDKPIIEITYSKENKFEADVLYKNIRNNYEIEIKNL